MFALYFLHSYFVQLVTLQWLFSASRLLRLAFSRPCYNSCWKYNTWSTRVGSSWATLQWEPLEITLTFCQGWNSPRCFENLPFWSYSAAVLQTYSTWPNTSVFALWALTGDNLQYLCREALSAHRTIIVCLACLYSTRFDTFCFVHVVAQSRSGCKEAVCLLTCMHTILMGFVENSFNLEKGWDLKNYWNTQFVRLLDGVLC